MKIKRFFAPDIRQAICMVRETLGPDAVILSNRNVDDGVEIVAARDFDEQTLQDKLSKQAVETPAGKVVQPAKSKPNNPVKRSAPRNAGIEAYENLSADAKQERTTKKRSAKVARTTANKAPGAKARTVPGAELNASGPNTGLQEVRKEIQQMRQLLDSRLSQLEFAGAGASQPTRIDLLRQLREHDVSDSLSQQIANQIANNESFEVAWQMALEWLGTRLSVLDENLLEKGGIVALVGPTGVGKTTSIAKLAAKYRMQHGPRQVALITTDNYRIAAHEQLNTYGRLLDIPVRVASHPDELDGLLDSFNEKRLVLIDTVGMSQRDMRVAENLARLSDSGTRIQTYLVMSATTQYRAMLEIVEAFRVCDPEACIMTKLDEAATLGPAFSTLIESDLPLAFIGDGQQVPEDLHRPYGPRLAHQYLTATQLVDFSEDSGDGSHSTGGRVAHG